MFSNVATAVSGCVCTGVGNRTTDIGQDKAENRENQGSRTDLSSKSRVKLNISVVKTLTVVADRPTVYVRVTPPCSFIRNEGILYLGSKLINIF